MRIIKFFAFVLILLLLKAGSIAAQNKTLPLNPVTNKIEYRKVYPSIFPGKNIVIKNFIFDRYQFLIPEEKIKNNLFKINANSMIKKSYSNKVIGELSYDITFWNRKDKFQLCINNLQYNNYQNIKPIPLEKIANYIGDTIELAQIINFTRNDIDSLIFSIDSYLSPYISHAPDLLVFKDSYDTVKCKIIEKKPTQIKFRYEESADTTTYTADTSAISYYKIQNKAAVDTFDEITENNKGSSQKKKINTTEPGGYVALNVGLSYRTAPMSSSVPFNMKSTANKMRKGIGFSGNFNYYRKNNLGMGIAFFYAQSSGTYYDKNNEFRKKIAVTLFAPSICYRIFSYDKNVIVHFTGFAGFMYYDEFERYGSGTFSANTLGYGASIGIDRAIGNNFVIGATLSYISGKFNSGRVTGSPSTVTFDGWEGLQRIEIGIGIRYFKKK